MKRREGKKRFPVSAGGLLVLAGFGTLMYLKNRMIPKYADDYAFSFVWDGKHHGNLAYGDQEYKRVRNFKDLARSQLSHYLTWSGRTVAETMNQIVMMKDDKHLYDILNTAAILGQMLLISAAGRGKKNGKSLTATLAALLAGGYWFGTPYSVHTVFWTTGAANYSWPELISRHFCFRTAADITTGITEETLRLWPLWDCWQAGPMKQAGRQQHHSLSSSVSDR